MSTKIIEIPDFNFSTFYYPQILEALLQYKRRNVPELTDESEFEPFIQLLRATALTGHLSNVLLDLVANESTLPTARLVDSVRNILRAIDYKLAPATPATVEMVYKLAKVFTSPYKIIPRGAQVATPRSTDANAIAYEANQDFTIVDTSLFSYVWTYYAEQDSWLDVTSLANLTTSSFSFLNGQTKTGDAIYFGHTDIMWDTMVFSANNSIGGFGYISVWEYYDGDLSRIQPDEVVQTGTNLKVIINSLLGIIVRAGTKVRVTLNSDGAYEDAISLWDGTQNYVQVGLLGQTVPSKKPNDYSVGSEWVELTSEDKTEQLFKMDTVKWTLPQGINNNWTKNTVGPTNQIGFAQQKAYWVRFRIVSAVSAISPIISNVRQDTGGQYIISTSTQGQVFNDTPLGSSTGLPDQTFKTSRDYYIVGTAFVTVDNEEWTLVENFFGSTSSDKHYTITIGANDRISINFGSGFQGKIPPIGVGNISARYRIGANNDGNVGPSTITSDKTGLTFVDSLFNPRQATGWREAEGSTEDSIERAKISGPASIRIRETAIGPDDVEWMVIHAYASPSGARPFSRTLAIEEGLGAKTIETIVVKRGGALASGEELDEMNRWFNGNKSLDLKKRIVANQRFYAFNYSPRVIDIEATVYSNTVTSQQIENNLRQTLQPEAVREDEITYEWDFGGLVPRSRLIHEIFNTDEGKISNVILLQPATDTTLGKRELPIIGNVSIRVLPVIDNAQKGSF